ncbi:MAG: damage-inducible mutagenesis protein [Alphaproteobacteria bacterium]|nr:damage-inducible mutagenesis protein [Alphaproteobacteria bacterium]
MPHTLSALRAAIARIERGGTAAAQRGAVPLGLAAIDDALPGGGLAAGAVHEVTGSAAGGFAAMLAGRFAGPVLWCVMERSPTDLYGPGLAAFGLDTRRLVVARCPSRQDMLWAMEEGLRDPALAVVAGEPDRAIALTASRRLQLAAETGGVTGLVLRHGAEDGALSPSAVFSRWRAESLPALGALSAPAEGARWRLELLRCRGGIGEIQQRTWTVDWCDATRDLSLVSGSRHRPAAAGTAERLAG